MEEFHAEIERWHDFFSLAGGAAATIIGLLFVSVTLRTDIRKAPETSLARAIVAHNFSMLLVVLLFSLYFLVPEMDQNALGLSIFFTAVLPCTGQVRSWLRLRRAGIDRMTTVWAFLVPALCYLLAMGVGVAFIINDTTEIIWFVTIVAMFLAIPTRNSWVLLLQSREDD